MKKVTEAALTAGLVAALLLTGCGEKRATDTNDNRPDVVQQGKQAGEDAAKGAKDMLDDGANAAKKMMENEQGMLMAAGSRIQDVIMELGETLGITMPQKIEQPSGGLWTESFRHRGVLWRIFLGEHLGRPHHWCQGEGGQGRCCAFCSGKTQGNSGRKFQGISARPV